MIKNPWFRLYAEFAHDPKVQMMSEQMQRRLIMLFCLQCSGELVTLHETLQVTEEALQVTNQALHQKKLDEKIAFVLRISDEELSKTKALFVANGFINERWIIMNWNNRQFISDSSLERVRKHRERKKKAVENSKKSKAVTETEQKQECNVTVTPPDTDTDTDTDTDIKEKTNKKEKSPVCVSDEQGDDFVPKEGAAIVLFCRSQGVNAVQNQPLNNLLEQGATMQHFVNAVQIAKDKGNVNWGYVMGIARNLVAESKQEAVPLPNIKPKTQQKKFDPLSYINNTGEYAPPVMQEHQVIDIDAEGNVIPQGAGYGLVY